MVASGLVDTDADRIYVRVSGAFTSAEPVAAVPIEDSGRTFRLGDITDVKRGYEEPPRFLVRNQGKPAVGVAVAMADGGNVLNLGENLAAAVKELRTRIPIGVRIDQIADQPSVVEESVSNVRSMK